MSAKPNPSPKPADPLRAGPSGCVLVLVAIVAAALGLFVGARYGMHVDKLSPPSPSATMASQDSSANTPKKRFWTCSMHPQVIREAPGQCPICHMQLVPLVGTADGGNAEAGAVVIDSAIVQNMGVRTAPVKRGPISRELRLTGYLSEAQPKVHEINLRIPGWIEKLYANYDGMYLHVGDPLFELYSPEIHQAAGELIGAAKSTMGHMAPLGDAARHKLELWGVSKAQIESIAKMDAAPRTVTFYSPISGHVLNKSVVEGAGVAAGQKLMNIVDHSQLWLDVTVYERDLRFVELGDHISATTEANPGAPLSGEIIFIHPHVDMANRAATARIELNNPGMSYRPGMFAIATFTKQLNANGLLVPRDAIIDTGTRQLVFLAQGNGHFLPRVVEVGADSDEGDVEITNGLDENDQVVTSGQFLLDSESRLKEAVQKYLAHEGAAPPPESAQMPIAATESTPQIPSAAPASPAAKANPKYDAVFKEYIAVHDALAAEKQDESAVDDGPLMEAVAAYADDPAAKDSAAFEKVSHSVHGLMEEKRADQREAFKKLSDDIIALAKERAPSTAAAPKLFVVHCSMAEADWLQTTDKVANPYLPDDRSCGEVKGEIKLGAAS